MSTTTDGHCHLCDLLDTFDDVSPWALIAWAVIAVVAGFAAWKGFWV